MSIEHSDFTASELQLLQNPQIMPLKRSATHKLAVLLGNTAEAIKQLPQHTAFTFPPNTDTMGGKISKGENYLEQPWLMLDLPRLFTQQSIFAYRVMFLWGAGFTFTLHLAGGALEQYLPALQTNFNQLQASSLFFCTNPNAWLHEVAPYNYTPINHLYKEQFNQHIEQYGFCKMTFFLPVSRLEAAKSEALAAYQFFLGIMSN